MDADQPRQGKATLSAAVLQASGVISVQVRCTPDAALDLLWDRALANSVSLEVLAHSVVAHETRFD